MYVKAVVIELHQLRMVVCKIPGRMKNARLDDDDDDMMWTDQRRSRSLTGATHKHTFTYTHAMYVCMGRRVHVGTHECTHIYSKNFYLKLPGHGYEGLRFFGITEILCANGRCLRTKVSSI